MVSSQQTVANAHTASQMIQLRALGINHPVTVTVPSDVRGQSVTFGRTPKVHAPNEATVDYGDGEQTISRGESSVDRLFERPAEKYRYEKSVGKDDTVANQMAEDRISNLVDNNLILSARLASQQTLKLVSDNDDRIIGYRRVIHPELSAGGVCGLCVAASDRQYYVSELQPIHSRCKCTIAPITKTHDPGMQLNRADLDQLYVHAADATPGVRSTSGKALKRTRYDIVHHHELGPVLTRVTGEKVPYLTAAPAA